MLNKLTELSYFKQSFFDFLRKLHLIIPELKKKKKSKITYGNTSFDPGCKRVMNRGGRSNEAATYRAPAINFLPIYYPHPLPVSIKKDGQKEKRARA